MSDTLTAAADEVRQKIGEKVSVMKADPSMAEVLRLHQGLNVLEELLNQPKSSLAQLFGLDSAGGADVAAPSPLSIRPDEFYGLDPLEAAKKYLKKRGQARPFKEIVDAIRRGGSKVSAGSEEQELRTRMARSTYEVAVMQDDHYGLVEFYPHLKRGKGVKKRAAAADASPSGPVTSEAAADAGAAEEEEETAETENGSPVTE